MILKNRDIYEINIALNKIGKVDISAQLAFKLFKIKKKIEDEVVLIQKSLEGKEDDNNQIEEVFDMENEIDINKIRASELEELKLSMEDVFLLDDIIDFEEEDNE